MDVLSNSNTRADLKEVMDRVVEDRAPVVITRHGAESVVMVSLSDWHAMEETLHLLSSPANAQRLKASTRSSMRVKVKNGHGSSHEAGRLEGWSIG